MIYSQSYIMQDQAKKLVPELIINNTAPSKVEAIKRWIQIAAFVMATGCYIGALSLTAY